MHADLADVIVDTAQNAIEAGATRIDLTVSETEGRIAVTIDDNGKGMDAATLARVFDPFYTEPGKHASRRVGLGLPMLRQICEACGGGVRMTSEPGKGTHLAYEFDAANIDLPPMGDLVKAVLTLFNYPGAFELVFTHRKGREAYSIGRGELADAVGGLETVEGLALAREFLLGQEESLG